jgi:hypothetical protein
MHSTDSPNSRKLHMEKVKFPDPNASIAFANLLCILFEFIYVYSSENTSYTPKTMDARVCVHLHF